MLVEDVGRRQLVGAACPRATGAGVRSGMTLAQARALCPTLGVTRYEPDVDARALVALGRWMTRYSPVVSPEPPDALFVDVEGCERLYGGIGRLLAAVREGLEGANVQSRLAVAPTPGAAWAVASYGQDGAVVGEDEVAERLAGLPVAALRLDEGTVAVLDHLGVKTVAELRALPRRALPSRFGTAILDRLDAALGQVAEPLVPVAYPITVEAAMEFEGAVESWEVIDLALRELVGRVAARLTRHGLGARLVRAGFRRAYVPWQVKEIRLTRPSRDAKTILRLLRCALEDLESEGGVIGVRLDVPTLERVAVTQLDLVEHEEEAGAEEADRLVEVLQARLGVRTVARPELVESHMPERAYRLAEVGSRGEAGGAAVGRGARPLYLFPTPVEVGVVVSPSPEGEGMPLAFTHEGEVHRVAYADGPERIEGLWWEGRDKTRDYFDVEDAEGWRFWLFRVIQTGRWYLHGVFI